MVYRIFGIRYDTDGEEVDLPKELFAACEPDDADEMLSNFISDKTGFCHFGFEFEVASKSFSFGDCPDGLIKAACNEQCPDGYPMTIKNQEEWGWIAAAVNLGIDSHLEALTKRSVFDNGTCNVHPDELHVLLRRLLEAGWDQTEDQVEGRSESPHSLRSVILSTLDIEEV